MSVRGLGVRFGRSVAVDDVSLDVLPGETMALVGESGSGKSVTARAVMGLLPPQARVVSGAVSLDGVDVLSASAAELRRLRGGVAAMVFQEPRPSLNPLHTVEKLIGETLRWQKGLAGAAARSRMLELLDMVGMDQPRNYLTAYPHELSGGQCQRVMIASALAGEPKLLIADEPTTALDVTVQRQILDLMADLTRRLSMSVLLISHDLGLVHHYADRAYVMRHGRVMEEGGVDRLFTAPRHEYTRSLVSAGAQGAPAVLGSEPEPILDVRDLKVWFPVRKGLLRRTAGHVKAVDGVSFQLRRGECLGLVGESGSGKTTLGMAVLRLLRGQGRVRFRGEELTALAERDMRPLRRRLQVVFQDPFGSLSPRMCVEDIVAEGLFAHGHPTHEEATRRVCTALDEVGLDPALRHRYPHEFSGGQRQRIAIARALVLRPELLVLDEPTSSLDRSVQFQVIDLLRDLQCQRGLGYLFITHDLHLTQAFCHRVLVMRDGRIVESGATREVFANPRHQYTRTLVDAAAVCGGFDELQSRRTA
nr:ABC transporter ATP-binding protein [Desulfobaculum xiamenense]